MYSTLPGTDDQTPHKLYRTTTTSPHNLDKNQLVGKQSTMQFVKAGKSNPFEEGRELPATFQPSEYTVICGKGKTTYSHCGNKRFRVLVEQFLDRYSSASSKLEKSAIVSSIIQTIRRNAQLGGFFVKKDTNTGLWYDVGDHLSREKVGQTIRDALHHKYKSSTKAKKKRREAEQDKAKQNMERISASHLQLDIKIRELQTMEIGNESDRELTYMLTKANLGILNELNRLKQLNGGVCAVEAL